MCPGWCGYLHALNLVSLVRAGSCALLVRVACVPWLVFALCFAGNFFRPRKARALLVRVVRVSLVGVVTCMP